MRSLLLLALACLLLASATSAAPAVPSLEPKLTANAKAAFTPAVKTDFTCSDDPWEYMSGSYGLVWIRVWSDGAWKSGGGSNLRIDGYHVVNYGQMWGYLTSIEATYKYTVEPGRHTFQISSDNMPENGTLLVCADRITYLNLNDPAKVTTAPTPGVTTATGSAIPPTTATTTAPGAITASQGVTTTTAQHVPLQTQAVTGSATAATTALPETTGSLSVKTEPSGATVFIDGVMRGASPATIPGLPGGSHTLLLKLEGYEDMAVPVTITAGKTQEYTTAMIAKPAAAATAGAESTTPKKSPGFEAIAGLAAAGSVLCVCRLRK